MSALGQLRTVIEIVLDTLLAKIDNLVNSMQKLQVSYSLLFICAVFMNYLLMLQGNIFQCMILLVVVSCLLSFLTLKRIRYMTNSGELERLNSSTTEAREIINETPLTPFRYLYFKSSSNGRPLIGITFMELLSDPVWWIVCISIFFFLFSTSSYTEPNHNSWQLIIGFVGITSMQILLLSFTFAGVAIKFKELTNRR